MVGEKALSVIQRQAAELRALGYTQQMVADQVGRDLRTVQRWCADDAFDARVRELRHLMRYEVEPDILANLRLAVKVQREVFLGQRDPKDATYKEAREFVRIFLARLLTADPDDRAPNVGANVQVNVGGRE